jgi:CheY-like chemotaxis protein
LLVAMNVESMLADHGAAQVETASSVDGALRKLQHFAPDAAILDLNLGAELSVPVAHELVARAIPFVFATGYGEANMIPAALRHVPIVRKPYAGETIAAALMQIQRR